MSTMGTTTRRESANMSPAALRIKLFAVRAPASLERIPARLDDDDNNIMPQTLVCR
jgi:hypothetical protein